MRINHCHSCENRSLTKSGMTFIIILLLFPALIFAQELPAPSIIINEIGALEPSETEWVEIYNKSISAQDLTGWKFFEDQTNHGLSLFRAKTGTTSIAVEPGEYAVIVNKAEDFAKKYPDYSGAIFDSSWGSLKEDGEEIGLKDNAGNLVEVFTYPAITGNLVSLERIDANTSGAEPTNWRAHPSLNSVGKPNENGLVVPEEIPPPPTQPQPTPPAIPVTPPPAEVEPQAPVQPSALPEPLATAPPPPPATPAPPQTIIITQPPPNSPPKAIIQIQSGDLVAINSTTINFDGRSSFDPNGDNLTFSWDMGDGEKETTANPAPHKYGKPGTYTVTLTVTDPQGLQNQAQQYVQVLNKPAEGSLSAAAIDKNPVPQNITFQNSAPSTSSAPQVSIPISALLPKNLAKEGITFELSGYLVLRPSGAKIAVTKAKTSTTKNKTTAKAPVKKTKKVPKKTVAKKQAAFKNGGLSDSIKITEVYPNPAQDEEEWIEIFNGSDRSVALGNWTLADSSKKSSPYKIPDEFKIASGEYLVFPKSETKLSLNNDKDEIYLGDFKGNIIDNVSYGNAPQKNNSYALIRIRDTAESDTTVIPRANAQNAAGDFVWEWTDEPTPNSPNPVFEKITGSVKRLVASGESSALEINTLSNETKIINFDSSTLDSVISQAILKEGASVSVQARDNKDGTYNLKKIEELRPAKEEEKPAQNNYLAWIAIGVIALSIILNAPPLIRALHKRITDRTPPV